MAVNKVEANGEVFIDLTADTATEADVAQGKTFHKANGEQATGTASGGAAPDYIVIQKDITFSSLISSGSQTFITASEFVSLGALSATSANLLSEWTNYDFLLFSTSTSPTTKQIIHGTLSNKFLYNNGYKYYRTVRYHNTSATSISSTQNNGSVTASANGFMFYTAGTGLRLTASSTYGLIGSYTVVAILSGRK